MQKASVSRDEIPSVRLSAAELHSGGEVRLRQGGRLFRRRPAGRWVRSGSRGGWRRDGRGKSHGRRITNHPDVSTQRVCRKRLLGCTGLLECPCDLADVLAGRSRWWSGCVCVCVCRWRGSGWRRVCVCQRQRVREVERRARGQTAETMRRDHRVHRLERRLGLIYAGCLW